MKAVGAYIFAGGFTLGVKQHFDVEMVLEEGPYGVPTMRHNQPEIPVHVGFENWPINHLKEAGIIDFIYGNPPCAAWSVSGKSATRGVDWRLDPRVNCTRKHFSLLEELRPRAWTWESVVLAYEKGKELVDELTVKAHAMGYQSTYLLHNAQYLGCPQQRKRFFFVATDCHFDLDGEFESELNADEVLRGLNDPGEPLAKSISKHKDILSQVRPGESLINAWMRLTPKPWKINKRGQVHNRPAFTITRCRAGSPAQVVMNDMIHPTEDRALSIKELQILSGYPSSYEFIGAKDAGQVGRGVCPPVGAWLARNVKRCLELNRFIEQPVQLIDCREGVVTVENLPLPDSTVLTEKIITEVSEKPKQREVTFTSTKSKLGSGAYIRLLLEQKCWTDSEILEAVHASFSGRKTALGDISFNRIQLARTANVESSTFKVTKSCGKPVPLAVDLQNSTLSAEFSQYSENMRSKLSEIGSINAPDKTTTLTTVEKKQPSRIRETVDPEREFDKTSLRQNSHGQWIHRDYGAHFFRWGFAGRYVTGTTDVLDVGCGPDVQMVNVLTMPRNQVPRSYTGIDLNKKPRQHPNRQWATIHWEFNFIERWQELGQFDLVTNFEMIEHMHKVDGDRLLVALAGTLRSSGTLLLSTPVFNGKAAANHLHEWTIPELTESIEKAGLKVVKRYGTFASQRDLNKVASSTDLEIVQRLRGYYSDEVLACFLAPLYPDASRNNLWVIQLK